MEEASRPSRQAHTGDPGFRTSFLGRGASRPLGPCPRRRCQRGGEAKTDCMQGIGAQRPGLAWEGTAPASQAQGSSSSSGRGLASATTDARERQAVVKTWAVTWRAAIAKHCSRRAPWLVPASGGGQAEGLSYEWRSTGREHVEKGASVWSGFWTSGQGNKHIALNEADTRHGPHAREYAGSTPCEYIFQPPRCD